MLKTLGQIFYADGIFRVLKSRKKFQQVNQTKNHDLRTVFQTEPAHGWEQCAT